MKSKLLATRLAIQDGPDFLELLRSDNWLASGFTSELAPQSAVSPGSPIEAVPPVISLTTSGVAYTQNFDTLSNTAPARPTTSPSTAGRLTETGGGARDNEQYAVDTGGSNTGDTYSYGSPASTDRALGELRSGTLIADLRRRLHQQYRRDDHLAAISYDGEQWRIGSDHATVADKIDFQISFNATSLTTGHLDRRQRARLPVA